MSDIKIKKEQQGDGSEPIDTSESPEVMYGIIARDCIVEELLRLIANPPDELVVLHRRVGGPFTLFTSGYQSTLSIIGAIEMAKMMAYKQWENAE